MNLPVPLVAFHFAAGAIALAGGTIAVASRKGSRPHVLGGRAFGGAMAAMLASAAALTLMGDEPGDVAGVVFFLYLVASGWQTVRSGGVAGAFERWTIAIPTVFAVLAFADGLQRAPGSIPPAGLMFFFTFVATAAAIGDARYLRRGSLPRVPKLSRHLWRLCFAFFAATGSFFLGQAKVLPDALRIPALLMVLAVAPLLVMLFWLVRVRLKPARPPGTPALGTAGGTEP